MAQTLKYEIGKDYRPLTVLEAKGGNTFSPDYDKSNWVQARQYEDSLRQVFVEITNEDGSAYDLTGANILFEGILPDNEHKILDNSHVVFYEDPTAGKFRFDMPAQAFSVAGQYKQAFFRVMKDYRNVATLEFKFEVLADMVVTGMVARDYVSPLEEFFNVIKDEQAKDSAELKKIVDDKINEITHLMTILNTANASTLAELGTAKNSLLDIEKKIEENGLFTQYQADKYKQNFDEKVNNVNKKIDNGLTDMNEKIQQANKSNTKLVEDKLAQIDTNVHAYPNVDAIKEAYPNGALGIFVAVDTGHQWYWVDGSWKDAGVYQTVGIANDSILPTYLTEQAKPIMLYPGNTPATYTTATKTLNFGKSMTFRTYHHKITKIPDNYELVLDYKDYSNAYIYVDLNTGIPGYEPYLYNKMPNNSAVIGYVSWSSQPYVDGKTEIMFGGQLGNYVVIDGRYHATSRDFLSNIYVTAGKGEGLVFDYTERTVTFPAGTNVFYGNNFHSVKQEVVAVPTEEIKNGATIERGKIVYNLKDDTAKIIHNFENIPGYITLGYLDTNIGFNEPYTKIISNLPIKAINLPENLSFKFRGERKEKTYNILHYGYHNGVPHESKLAFLKSIEMGYDLDGDIVFTKDNIPILSHSNSTTTGLLERIRNLDGTEVTDVFDINNKTYDELCHYDWGIYMGEQYKGMKPLKLEDFFKLVRAYDCYAYLEFKTKLSDDNWKLLRKLVNSYQVIDRIYWESFTDRFYNIKKLVQYMPNANISLITMDSMYQTDEFRSMLDQANTSTNVVTAMVASDMSVEKVKEIIDYGYQVDIWVVNDRETVEKYSSLPISGWATDGFDAKKVYQELISK